MGPKFETKQELDVNSHSGDSVLKLVGTLWNKTFVEVLDELSSTTVGFIRSERELENVLIWSLKCLLSMLRCLLGSVKSEKPKGKGKLGNEKMVRKLKIKLKLIGLGVV